MVNWPLESDFDPMTSSDRCKAAKSRLLVSRKSKKEQAIIELVDEYMRSEPHMIDAMCQSRLVGVKGRERKFADQLTKEAVEYVREKKAGIPILGGILWFFIKGLVARIVADYISDLLFSAGE